MEGGRSAGKACAGSWSNAQTNQQTSVFARAVTVASEHSSVAGSFAGKCVFARGQMRPLDARILLMHVWAMTQSYADYAIQTRVMLGLPSDAPIDREPIARELVAFVLAGCGIRAS